MFSAARWWKHWRYMVQGLTFDLFLNVSQLSWILSVVPDLTSVPNWSFFILHNIVLFLISVRWWKFAYTLKISHSRLTGSFATLNLKNYLSKKDDIFCSIVCTVVCFFFFFVPLLAFFLALVATKKFSIFWLPPALFLRWHTAAVILANVGSRSNCSDSRFFTMIS